MMEAALKLNINRFLVGFIASLSSSHMERVNLLQDILFTSGAKCGYCSWIIFSLFCCCCLFCL